MLFKRFEDAQAYEAPNHWGVVGLRLQGFEEGGPENQWIGLSQFLPGGGAGPDSTPFEKVYVVLEGEMTITVDGENTVLRRFDSCTIPAGQEWVKKIADKNCMSADPEDCLVWCLVEIPEQQIDRYELIDTSQSKEYEIEYITSKRLVQKGGHVEWKEVICQPQINNLLVSQLNEALFREGIDFTPTNKFNRTLKNALISYQRANGLPIGNLDVETLDLLGINY